MLVTRGRSPHSDGPGASTSQAPGGQVVQGPTREGATRWAGAGVRRASASRAARRSGVRRVAQAKDRCGARAGRWRVGLSHRGSRTTHGGGWGAEPCLPAMTGRNRSATTSPGRRRCHRRASRPPWSRARAADGAVAEGRNGRGRQGADMPPTLFFAVGRVRSGASCALSANAPSSAGTPRPPRRRADQSVWLVVIGGLRQRVGRQVGGSAPRRLVVAEAQRQRPCRRRGAGSAPPTRRRRPGPRRGASGSAAGPCRSSARRRPRAA